MGRCEFLKKSVIAHRGVHNNITIFENTLDSIMYAVNNNLTVEIDVRLTNKSNDDGTTGAPVLYANIPIMSVKEEAKEGARKVKAEAASEKKEDSEKEEKTEKESHEEVFVTPFIFQGHAAGGYAGKRWKRDRHRSVHLGTDRKPAGGGGHYRCHHYGDAGAGYAEPVH